MASPSRPAPPPAPRSGGGANKLLIGCGLGCGLLLLLGVAAAAVFYLKVVKPAAESAQKLEALSAENEAAAQAVVDLETANPSPYSGDLGEVRLSAADLDAYVTVRRELADEARAMTEARERMVGVFDPSQFMGGGTQALSAAFGMMGNMFGAMVEAGETRRTLLQAAAPVLTDQGMGPTQLQQLLELVEWRFLQRPEAVGLALSDAERSEYLEKKWQAELLGTMLAGAGAQMGGGDRAKMERQVQEAQDRLQELEAAAAERVDLDPKTRRLLETRRSELESLPLEGLVELGSLTEADAGLADMASGGPFGGAFGP